MAAKFTCKYALEEINSLEFMECMTILEENHVDYEDFEDIEELQDFIIKMLQSNKDGEVTEVVYDRSRVPGEERDKTQSNFTSSADLMNQIIAHDQEIKKELNNIYVDLGEFFRMKEFVEEPELRQELEIEFREVEKLVQEYSSELMHDECPIVVAGETSAGKSSLLNLLLGSNILPSSVLSKTSTICRLHNNNTKMIKVYDNSGLHLAHHHSLQDDVTADQLKRQLDPYISCDNNPYKYVDIYWPIPFLGRQVIIVDTPGVGENRKMASRLWDYLPKAVAFIYVINSENAGGVQHDRLLKIIEEQKQWSEDGRKQTFDAHCAMFVCNKWDQVPAEERDRVWDNTRERLRTSWPYFQDSQMFRLSTLEASRRYGLGLGYPDDFITLLRGIEKMVPISFQEKVKQHAWWQEKLLKKILHHVTARINNTRLTEEEKQRRKVDVEERLRRLESDTDEVQTKLENEARQKCTDISQKLYDHIHDHDTMTRLCAWTSDDIPARESDLQLIEHEAKEQIQAKIAKETRQWCENENLSDITRELAVRFREEYRLLEEQCQHIDNLVLDVGSGVMLDDVRESIEESRHIPLFAKKEQLALVLAAPLWIPLMVLAVTLAAPIMAMVTIRDKIKEKEMLKKYLKGKHGFMNNWALEIISEISKESISKRLEMTYLENFHHILEQLCNVVIPQQIQSDQELIRNLQQEERRSSAIRRQYHPLEVRCKHMAGKLLFVEMEYFYKDRILSTDIMKGKYIAGGSYSRVYQAEFNTHGKKKVVALKCMMEPLDYSVYYTQLTEVNTLIQISHRNIVQLYGISYEIIGGNRYLQILMELCDCSLESQIFSQHGRPSNIRPCSQFTWNSSDIEGSFDFLKRVMMDVSAGLVFIHHKNFIHRDLKPDNILLKGHQAKIADVGLTKETCLITGTFTGTPSYIAPEIIHHKLYGTEVDIYSLGIILWEIWYGEKAYGHDHLDGQWQLFEQVKADHRPSLQRSNSPPLFLKMLMKKCWHGNRKCRPHAAAVFEAVKNQQAVTVLNVDQNDSD